MKVEALPSGTDLDVPEAMQTRPVSSPTSTEGAQFGRVVSSIAAALGRADNAENAFAAGTGGLQEAVYERARADVVLSVATAAASRAAQAASTILGMQV